MPTAIIKNTDFFYWTKKKYPDAILILVTSFRYNLTEWAENCKELFIDWCYNEQYSHDALYCMWYMWMSRRREKIVFCVVLNTLNKKTVLSKKMSFRFHFYLSTTEKFFSIVFLFTFLLPRLHFCLLQILLRFFMAFYFLSLSIIIILHINVGSIVVYICSHNGM